MGLLRAMIEYLKEDEDNEQETVNPQHDTSNTHHETHTTEHETVNTHHEAEVSPLVSFVATDLDLRTERLTGEQDIEFDGKVYRQIDPEYFAWLRARMVQALSAHENGKMNDTDWDMLRGRFNRIQEVAINEFGKGVLEEAVSKLDPKTYLPPVTLKKEVESTSVPIPDYPGDRSYKFTQPVTHSALAKVNAISDEAFDKGWSEARLYQNQGRFKFPCGQDYGLICFLDDECETGAITKQSIEIKHGANSLKFYNPDVEQPWIKKVKQGGK